MPKVELAVLLLLLLTGCSTKPDKTPTNPEVYPDFGTEAKKSIANPDQPDLGKPRNTATFHTVEIKQMMFVPPLVRLHSGDTVLWINKDITDHDITEETKKKWTSSKFSMGKSWSKIVRESADYYCSIHVVMKGKLVVE